MRVEPAVIAVSALVASSDFNHNFYLNDYRIQGILDAVIINRGEIFLILSGERLTGGKLTQRRKGAETQGKKM
jgi:hypothetical protein